MTREEAIKILKTERYCQEDTPILKQVRKAYDMAIEALEAYRLKGAWIKVIDHDGILMEYYVCDKCGMLTTDCSNFCPNCGAKMDGK